MRDTLDRSPRASEPGKGGLVVPRWISNLTVGLLLIAGAVAVAWWALKPEPIPVKVVEVRHGRVEESVTNSRAGTLKARQRAKISPELGARVTAINYKKGDRVKAGEVIVRLNDAPQRANLLLAERELVVARATGDQACLKAERSRRAYRRNKMLSAKEAISKDLLDELLSASQSAAAACRAARADVERAEAAITQAEAELAKTVVRAPFDGVIAELDTEVGEWTTPAPPVVPVPPIIDLIDPSSIYVSAPMDEVDSARVHPSQPVRITLDSYPGRSFAGRVTRVAPYVLDVEEQNRTVEIEVDFDDKRFASSLLPGTSADVEVILSARADVLRIPSLALLEGNRVYLAENGHLAEVPVEVGLKNWDYAEITAGLSAGQVIVTSLDRPGLASDVPIVIQESR